MDHRYDFSFVLGFVSNFVHSSLVAAGAEIDNIYQAAWSDDEGDESDEDAHSEVGLPFCTLMFCNELGERIVSD